MPTSPDGYNAILVMTEYATRFPMAWPIKNKEASTVAAKLMEYIALFGPPRELLSDQGTEFLNETVNSLLHALGTEHQVTSAYNPRTNGLTERCNATLTKSLEKHAHKNPSERPTETHQ